MTSNEQTAENAAEISDAQLAPPQAKPPVRCNGSVIAAVPSSRSRGTYHLIFLGIAAAVVALSIFLEVGADEDTVLFGDTGVPLPGTCVWKKVTGVGCPGCGLTRCFVSLGHGDPVRGWQYNPAGLLAYGFVLFQFPYRAVQLWRVRRGQPEVRMSTVGYWFAWIVTAAVMGQWVIRLVIRML